MASFSILTYRKGSTLNRATNTLGVAVFATFALLGCEQPGVDPITRAAIFGCIEIAEAGSYSDSIRATALERAGCGRYSSRQINAALPDYRAEQARKVEEAKTRAAAWENRRSGPGWDPLADDRIRLATCGDKTFKYTEQKVAMGSKDNMRMFLGSYRSKAEAACVGFSTEEISEASAKARAAFEAEEAIRVETRRRIEAVASDG